jgi:hypothetical protein
MSETPVPALPAPDNHAWTVFGIIFIVFWVVAHIALFFFSFLGGIFGEILLSMLKTVTLPGLVINSQGKGMEMGWVLPLQVGVTLAGLAGIPAGLAFFWRGRRLRLWAIAAGLFFAGVALEIYAVYRLVSDSFSGLAQ